MDAAEAVEFLNSLLPGDDEALRALILTRVPCSDALLAHPTVQVGYVDDDPTKPLEVGFLGLINGLFGADAAGFGYIGADFQVACRRGCEAPQGKAGEQCPECGAALFLGHLERFRLLPEENPKAVD